jgi:hypothetical protein
MLYALRQTYNGGRMYLKYRAVTAAGTLLLMLTGRELLFERNLFSNGFGVRTGEKVNCSERALQARTEDGVCNDLAQPLMGAANVPLGRNVPPSAVVRENESRTLFEPNPIAVSRELLQRNEFKPLPLNLLVTNWIQFMNHDWFDHNNVERDYAHYYKVPIPEKYRGSFRQTGLLPELFQLYGNEEYMVLPRTRVDGGKKDSNGNPYSVFGNKVTHWWDGSQIYGSSGTKSAQLRSFQNGRMIVNQQNLIPISTYSDSADLSSLTKTGIEKTGFIENWWTGLSMLHNVFIRNHNLLASDRQFVAEIRKMLSKPGQSLFAFDHKNQSVVSVSRAEVFGPNGAVVSQPKYEAVLDQMIYDKARLVNTAIMAKIHTVEWTPSVLQTTPLDVGMRTNWFGVAEGQLRKNVDSSKVWDEAQEIAEKLGIREFFRSQKAAGLVGGKKNTFGVPFNITEEFTAVYRLHSLLPESVALFHRTGNAVRASEQLPVIAMREEKSKSVRDRYTLGELFYSFGQNRSGQLVLGNFPNFLQNLDIPIMGKLDMGAVDILRDRERGVPRYNQFRRKLHMKEIVSFADLFAYNSNLQANASDCRDNEVQSIRRAKDFPTKLAVATAALSKYSRDSYNYRHCKLRNMQYRVDDYIALYKELSGIRNGAVNASTNPGIRRKRMELGRLAAQIRRDANERYYALTAEQKQTVQKMRTLYNSSKLEEAFQLDYQKALGLTDNVEALDLLVGTLAESFRGRAEPDKHLIGFGFGETPFQIFLLMASLRLIADRYYTDSYRPEIYTQRGLDVVKYASFKGVLACNLKNDFPEIEKAFRCVRTAFDPWNDVNGSPNCRSNQTSYEEMEQSMIRFYKGLCS